MCNFDRRVVADTTASALAKERWQMPINNGGTRDWDFLGSRESLVACSNACGCPSPKNTGTQCVKTYPVKYLRQPAWIKAVLGVLLLQLLGMSASATASDLIKRTSYLEDSTGTLNANELAGENFTRFTGMLARGYTPSVYWIKLEAKPQAQLNDTLVLRIRPTYLDDIQPYHTDSTRPDHSIAVDHTGDRYPWSDDEYRSLNFNFFLSGKTLPNALYLRIETSSSLLIYPELLPLKEALAKDRVLDVKST